MREGMRREWRLGLRLAALPGRLNHRAHHAEDGKVVLQLRTQPWMRSPKCEIFLQMAQIGLVHDSMKISTKVLHRRQVACRIPKFSAVRNEAQYHASWVKLGDELLGEAGSVEDAVIALNTIWEQQEANPMGGTLEHSNTQKPDSFDDYIAKIEEDLRDAYWLYICLHTSLARRKPNLDHV